MALVRLVDIDELEGAPRAVADSGNAQYGQLLNTWRAIMNRPEMFETYLPFLRKVAGPGVLDQKLKDLCALYVGVLNHCRYTASHRSTSALKNGVDETTLVQAAIGDWASFDERTRIALEFTKELTLNPAELEYSDLPQAVASEVLASLKNNFSDAEIVDLAMTVAMWNALARFHRVMGFELDMPEAPKGVNPK